MERSRERLGDNQAQADDQGKDPSQVGPRSAGQAGDSQELSHLEDMTDESVEELEDTDQAWEAAELEGLEDASDHPERPAHTHLDYGRPDDVPPQNPVAREKPEPAQAQPAKHKKSDAA
jgi:hypothetical protein